MCFSFLLNNKTKLLSAVDGIFSFVVVFCVCVCPRVCVCVFCRHHFHVLFSSLFIYWDIFLILPLFPEGGLGDDDASALVFHINGPTEVSRRRGK